MVRDVPGQGRTVAAMRLQPVLVCADRVFVFDPETTGPAYRSAVRSWQIGYRSARTWGRIAGVAVAGAVAAVGWFSLIALWALPAVPTAAAVAVAALVAGSLTTAEVRSGWVWQPGRHAVAAVDLPAAVSRRLLVREPWGGPSHLQLWAATERGATQVAQRERAAHHERELARAAEARATQEAEAVLDGFAQLGWWEPVTV